MVTHRRKHPTAPSSAAQARRTDAAAQPNRSCTARHNHPPLLLYKANPHPPTGSASASLLAFPKSHHGLLLSSSGGGRRRLPFASCAIPAPGFFLPSFLPMDSNYVASLLMAAASAPPGLDFGALDGGFLDTLCGGGAGAGFAAGGAGLFGVRGGAAAAGGGRSREGSSVSDQAWARARDGGNARKRKAPARAAGGGKGGEDAGLGKVGEAKGPDGERCRVAGGEGPVKPKVEEATASDGSVGDRGAKEGKGKSPKPPAAGEPPKDYVHVRARRGQATDSRSLAERVRREKISQRMKFLQDLVPGCNKVVGKALMLDEIINYVQSLQQQVEFLSMKLATVNPQLDFSNLPTLLHTEMYQACGPSQFPLESAGAAFPFCDQADLFQSFGSGAMEDQRSLSLLGTALPHTTNPQFPFQKQQRDFWKDGLQNSLHIGSEQSQEDGVSAPNFDGQLQADHTAIEF